MIYLNDYRKSNDPQLWVAGCSITYGVGVERTQRYGDLLAKHLELQVSTLAVPGSSIEWASDQLIRSDIRTNDLAVIGLTDHRRFSYWSNNKLQQVNVGYYQQNPNFDSIISVDRLLDENLIYQSLASLHRLINFCNKLDVKFIIAGILTDEIFFQHVQSLPNFVNLNQGTFIDLGQDNYHPGKKTHRWYADEIYKLL
jgi:hypothetical protein